MSDDNVTDSVITPGERLLAARAAAGLSLEEVAKTLHILPSNIRAIEENRFGDILKGATFVRGYLRAYAALVKLDGEALVADYNSHYAPPEKKVAGHVVKKSGRLVYAKMTMPVQRSSKRMLKIVVWLVTLLILIVGLGFVAGQFWFSQSGSASDYAQTQVAKLVLPDEAPVPELQEDISEVPAQATPALNEQTEGESVLATASQGSLEADPDEEALPLNDRLEFELSGDSWIEVRDEQGNRLFADLARKGSGVSLEGNSPFNIIIGDGRSVTLRYNGRPLNYSYARNGYAEITVP